jgi:stage V sporulation protein D (sporulation-specific penicillin-binding protein)
MLESVVNNGTGRNCKIVGYRIGGKTATSEKIDEKNEQGVADKRIVAFMAFAPADDPKIAVLMLLDEPNMPVVSGGMLVAPSVKAFLQDVLPYLGYEPQLTAEEITKNEVVVPNFVSQSSADAVKSINNLKLKYKLVGGEGTVKYQIPTAGQRIPAEGVVMLYTNSESPPQNITVPNIAGMSPSSANAAIINAGLNVKFTTPTDVANLIVGSCNPAIGTSVPPGTVINIELRLVNNND